MELKNIFKMTKTDRYTQDGRDELAKLQETEDVKYKTGDISQKTGLQKQPDGSWAPPKKGARSGAGKPEAAEGWTETRMASGKLYDLKSQGKRIIEQYDPETETKTFKLRDLNNSRAPDKEFKTLEEAKAAAGKKDAAKSAGSTEKPAASFPSHSGMDAEQYDKKLRQEGWKQTGEYSKNAAGHNVGYFEKNGKRIQVVENSEGRIAGVDEVKPKTEAKPAAESKPAADFTKYKRDTGLNLHGKSAEEGEQYMKENGFELVRNDPDYKVYKNEYGEEYDAFYTQAGVFNGGSHTKAPIPNIQNHKDYQKGLGNKYLGQKKFEDGTITQVYLTPEGKYETSHFTTKGEYNGGSTSNKEFYDKWYGDWDLEDSAPRILTGDTKIRVRK